MCERKKFEIFFCEGGQTGSAKSREKREQLESKKKQKKTKSKKKRKKKKRENTRIFQRHKFFFFCTFLSEKMHH